jgi:hypothetical protein
MGIWGVCPSSVVGLVSVLSLSLSEYDPGLVRGKVHFSAGSVVMSVALLRVEIRGSPAEV